MTQSPTYDADLKEFLNKVQRLTIKPAFGFHILKAVQSSRGLTHLTVQLFPGFDKFQNGEEAMMLEHPEKYMRIVGGHVAHGDADPANWRFILMAELFNCTPDELTGVFIISRM